MSSLQESIRRIKPAIVQIVVSATLPEETRVRQAIVGTGFFVAEDQYVATAAHVFKATQEELVKLGGKDIVFEVQTPLRDITAEFHSRQGFLTMPFAIVEFADEHDLVLLKTTRRMGKKGVRAVATIKVKGKTKKYEMTDVRTAAIHAGNVNVGEEVAVAGFPLQTPYLVAQSGIVSATPIIPVSGTPNEEEQVLVDIMVNPGNSGGPAFLAKNGKVIGVCRAHRTSSVRTETLEQTPLRQNAGIGLITPAKFLIQLLERHRVKWQSRYSLWPTG